MSNLKIKKIERMNKEEKIKKERKKKSIEEMKRCQTLELPPRKNMD